MVRFKINREHVCGIVVCVPNNCKEEESDLLYDELQTKFDIYNNTDHTVVALSLIHI